MKKKLIWKRASTWHHIYGPDCLNIWIYEQLHVIRFQNNHRHNRSRIKDPQPFNQVNVKAISENRDRDPSVQVGYSGFWLKSSVTVNAVSPLSPYIPLDILHENALQGICMLNARCMLNDFSPIHVLFK